jgi:SAM-dependent methyltransferase
VKMVRMAPPGTLCQNQAVLELVEQSGASTFCEIGPGAGDISASLCRRGLRGTGIELSPTAAAAARDLLAADIQAGRYHLVEGDFARIDDLGSSIDLALSLMVMEHVKDDAAFVGRMVRLVRPGGTVIVGVPARMDRWGIEDETAGHFRRYDRKDLERMLIDAGLQRVDVRSVSVPVANLTFHVSNFLIDRAGERRKLQLSQEQRTESSGIRDIPFKTVFPAPFKLVLNPISMYPFFLLQRLFYRSGLGLTLLASGRRPDAPT